MENDLSRVVDALPGLVWTALPDGRVDFLSRRWCEYTGRDVEEGYGYGWQGVIHPDDLPDFVLRWRTVLASQQSCDAEVGLRRFDGTFRWFLLHACPLTDTSGRIVKWFGVNTDVSLRHLPTIARVARDLDGPLFAHAADADSLGALTASIAHEVNQPLSGIIINASTCLRMLASDPPNVDGAREAAQRTIRDGNRASGVIARLCARFGRKAAAPEVADVDETGT
jgi:PAS domain S-box-containing protein